MKKKPLIFIAVIISAGLLIFFFAFLEKDRVSWYKSLKKNNDQPYGALLISSLLRNYHPEKEYEETDSPLENYFTENEIDEETNYVFIGTSMYASKRSQRALLSFVEEGNNAFLSVEHLPSLLFDTLFYYDDEENYSPGLDYIYDHSVLATFTHPQLRGEAYELNFYNNFDTVSTYWSFYERDNYEPKTELIELGILERGSPIFLRIKWGDGNFYIHTIPIAFSNYYIKNEEGLAYAEKVFSHLPEANILWDEVSKRYIMPEYDRNFSPSPLRFILTHESLRWAWYLLLSMVLLFVVFRSKRVQKIIPIVDPLINTSLEFVQTVGKLHYQHLDHKALAKEKMKLFLAELRSKYRISTNKLDDQFVKLLSRKTQVAEEDIQKIITIFDTINNFYKISEGDLKRLYVAIETFNKKAKSQKEKQTVNPVV